MHDREKVINAVETAFELWIDEFTGCSWFKEDEVRQEKEDAIALLKEQPEIVRCKDCIHRGESEKCVLAAISEEKNFPLFILDNRGDWFCADGKKSS